MSGTARFDFTGESAVVTGSTKGIGRGIAEGLAEAGANVLINSRTPRQVDQTAEELNTSSEGEVVGVAADVGEPEGVESVVRTAVDAFGRIDLYVNNAAVWPREESMLSATLEDWNTTMNVNVRAAFYATTLVGRHMVENDVRGNIIYMTSQTGDRRSGPRGIYGITKTAINGLTWRMANHLAREGIRVNFVSTDLTDSYQVRKEARMQLGDWPECERPESDVLQVLEEWGKARPLGRLGTPEDIANAVMFLASDRAGYIVGEILRVAGGGNLGECDAGARDVTELVD